MGASAKRNNYHKANSYQQQVAEEDELYDLVQEANRKLYNLTRSERITEISRLVKQAKKDPNSTEGLLVKRLILSGMWFPEFFEAQQISPNSVVGQPVYMAEVLAKTKALREQRIKRSKNGQS